MYVSHAFDRLELHRWFSCSGSALRCRRSEIRIPDWVGYGQVYSKPLEGCVKHPAIKGLRPPEQMYVYIYIYTYVYTYLYIYLSIYLSLSIHMYIYIYISIHIYIYIYILGQASGGVSTLQSSQSATQGIPSGPERLIRVKPTRTHM